MKKLIILFTFTALVSCNFEIEGPIQHIYKLSSPDGQTAIYESYIDSPMAFGSGHIEKTVLNKGDNYNPRKKGNFDNYTILGWIGNDTLRVIKFHPKTNDSTIIPKTELLTTREYRDFILQIEHRTSFGGGKDWFEFDTAYFKKDSIYFCNGRTEKLGLLKGQVRIKIEGDSIKSIKASVHRNIEDVFAKIDKGNKFGYPHTVGDIYELTPKYNIKPSFFSEQPVTIEIKSN